MEIGLLLVAALFQGSGDAVSFPGARQPQVAVSADGKVSVVMLLDGQIQVAVSADGGKTFGEPRVAIDANGRARGGLRRGPRIGVDKKGTLIVTAPVCFDEAEFKKRYPRSELFITRSKDSGKSWSKPLQINSASKKAAESLHWLAVEDDGDAHVVWLDSREKKANCVWYAKVTPKKVGKNMRLSDPVCPCCAPGLALDGKGNPLMVVRDGSKKDKGVLIRMSRNGGRKFTPPMTVNEAETNVDG